MMVETLLLIVIQLKVVVEVQDTYQQEITLVEVVALVVVDNEDILGVQQHKILLMVMVLVVMVHLLVQLVHTLLMVGVVLVVQHLTIIIDKVVMDTKVLQEIKQRQQHFY